MRQISKKSLTIQVLIAFVLASVVPCGISTALAEESAEKRFILTDPLTGVALSGYDAVSYFTDNEPLNGRPEFAYEWGGTTWYFASSANRDVFKRAPETYTPEFGGYCAMSMARGYLADGNPRIHAILAGRLFLFYSTGNRDAFIASPRAAYLDGRQTLARLSGDREPISADEDGDVLPDAQAAGAADEHQTEPGAEAGAEPGADAAGDRETEPGNTPEH